MVDFRPGGGLRAQPGGPVFPFFAAFDTNYANTYGRPIFISYLAGVVAQPGQNGHIYLEITKASPVSWVQIDYIACRNNQAAGTGGVAPVGGGNAQIAAGQGLTGFCPAGWFFRLHTVIPGGYAAPSNVADTGVVNVVVL